MTFESDTGCFGAAAPHPLCGRLDRPGAVRELTLRHHQLMHGNEPVHTWPLS